MNTVGRLLHNTQKTENIWIMPQRNHFRLGGTECRRTQETGTEETSPKALAKHRSGIRWIQQQHTMQETMIQMKGGKEINTKLGMWNKKTKCDPVSWKRDKASGKVPMQLANTLLTGYLISSLFKVYSSYGKTLEHAAITSQHIAQGLVCLFKIPATVHLA